MGRDDTVRTVAEEDQALGKLQRLAEEWQVPLSPGSMAALLSYGRLLLQWNERINLTGAKSLAELIDDHFPDAFAIAKHIGGKATVVDVGSGGGLPALPLALTAPQISVLLVEPIRKKVAFLRTAIRASGLSDRVSLVAERWESALPGDPVPADVAISRATFHPEEWLKRGWSLVRPGGRVLVLSAQPWLRVPEHLEPDGLQSYAGGTRWLLSFRRST
jgi:16S rRNA (guanine527-N7)-methyltransferase